MCQLYVGVFYVLAGILTIYANCVWVFSMFSALGVQASKHDRDSHHMCQLYVDFCGGSLPTYADLQISLLREKQCQKVYCFWMV